MSDLTRIFDRIASGMFTPADVHTIREHPQIRQNRNEVRVGRTSIDLRESGDITIENRVYRGHEAQTIREVLGQVCGSSVAPGARRGHRDADAGSSGRWSSRWGWRPTSATRTYPSIPVGGIGQV